MYTLYTLVFNVRKQFSITDSCVLTRTPVFATAFSPADIVVKPTDSEVYEGATILATCVAYGGSEQPVISWFKGDSLTPLDNSSRVIVYQDTITENGLNFSVSILELCGVGVEDDAVYHCQAENANASVTYTDRANFTLTVISGGTYRLKTTDCTVIVAVQFHHSSCFL